MGSEWNPKRRSPMDTGGSGDGTKRMKAFALAFIAGGAVFVLTPVVYIIMERLNG